MRLTVTAFGHTLDISIGREPECELEYDEPEAGDALSQPATYYAGFEMPNEAGPYREGWE